MDINEINQQIAELDGQINAIKQKSARRIDVIKLKQEKLKQKKNYYLINMFQLAGLDKLSHEQVENIFGKMAMDNC